jgi:hypothetical protein
MACTGAQVQAASKQKYASKLQDKNLVGVELNEIAKEDAELRKPTRSAAGKRSRRSQGGAQLRQQHDAKSEVTKKRKLSSATEIKPRSSSSTKVSMLLSRYGMLPL